MSDMHPHWQSTDDGERAVRITSVQKNKKDAIPSNAKVVRASRKPAAIAGIALMLAFGFVWSGGMTTITSLLGQASTSITVTITPNGVNPETITVTPGETITWTNTDSIPHILASDTLPTSDGQPFMTSAIFPNASTHFLVPMNAADGTYSYISKTAQNISGHVVIQGAAAATTSQPSMQENSAAFIPPPLATASSSPDLTQNTSAPSVSTSDLSQFASSSEAPIPAATNGLPENPHTVGTAPSLPTREQPGSKTASVSSHTPASEPATGPDVDVVIALSAVAVLWISRKAFRILA